MIYITSYYIKYNIESIGNDDKKERAYKNNTALCVRKRSDEI